MDRLENFVFGFRILDLENLDDLCCRWILGVRFFKNLDQDPDLSRGDNWDWDHVFGCTIQSTLVISPPQGTGKKVGL